MNILLIYPQFPDTFWSFSHALRFIGKKRAQGFGEVAGWSVEKTDLDPLLDENGAPRRPIPEHLFGGDKSLPLQDLAWKPAYWNLENRAACYAPNPL